MSSAYECSAQRYCPPKTSRNAPSIYSKTQVIPVSSGSCTLKDAVNDALRTTNIGAKELRLYTTIPECATPVVGGHDEKMYAFPGIGDNDGVDYLHVRAGLVRAGCYTGLGSGVLHRTISYTPVHV